MFTNCEFDGQQQQNQQNHQNQQHHGYFLRSTVRNTGSSSSSISSSNQHGQHQQQQQQRDMNNNFVDQAAAEHEETHKAGRSRSKLPSASSSTTNHQPTTSANANNTNMYTSTTVTASSNQHGYPSNGGAVKRGYDYVDAMDDDQDYYDQATLSSSGLSSAYGNTNSSYNLNSNGGSRRSPAKKSKSLVTYKEMTDFFQLLESKTIKEFLKRDSCCLISDKVGGDF
jgi:hypothetical protein